MLNRLIARCLAFAVLLVFTGCMIVHHWVFLVRGPSGPMFWTAIGQWVENEGIEFCRRLAFVGRPAFNGGPFPSSWVLWILVAAVTTWLYWIFTHPHVWRR